MKEFIVNNFITLKQENNETIIYIAGERFIQCKILLLEIPIKKISSFNGIESVDEAAERLDQSIASLDSYEYNIPSETKFWGHCSNLQVWAENNYDTRLLHSTLAFPLLEKLYKVGDPIAKNVFKEEIANRLESGCQSVIYYLYEEGFIYDFLSEEEIMHSLLIPEEAEIILELESHLKTELYQRWKALESKTFIVEDRQVTALDLGHSDLKEVPDIIYNLKNLRQLNLYHNKINHLQETIDNFPYLEKLILYGNELTDIPHSVANLKRLSHLDLGFNKFTGLPKPLKELKSLRYLNLSGNELTNLNEQDISEFKDTFIQVAIPESRLFRIIKTMKHLFKNRKSIHINDLMIYIHVEWEVLDKIVRFHKKEMEKFDLKISYNDGIISKC